MISGGILLLLWEFFPTHLNTCIISLFPQHKHKQTAFKHTVTKNSFPDTNVIVSFGSNNEDVAMVDTLPEGLLPLAVFCLPSISSKNRRSQKMVMVLSIVLAFLEILGCAVVVSQLHF